MFQLVALVLDHSMCTRGLVSFRRARLSVPGPFCPSASVLPRHLHRQGVVVRLPLAKPGPSDSPAQCFAPAEGHPWHLLLSGSWGGPAFPCFRGLTQAWLWTPPWGAWLGACLASCVVYLLIFCSSPHTLLSADRPNSILISHLPFPSNFWFFNQKDVGCSHGLGVLKML